MAKKFSGVSQFLSRFRGWFQAGAALLTNLHLPNFLKGGLYQGAGKAVCVPGLNCYSCPGATGACPIGAFQAVVGSSKFGFSYYITGFLILLGVLLGRFICGFLCPFGWFQELLHKIPFKKFSTKRLKPLTISEICRTVGYGISSPTAFGKRCGNGRPVFLQVPLPTGRARGGNPTVLCKFRHSVGAGRTLYMEAQHSDCTNGTERDVLSPVLQMVVSAGCILRIAEQGVSVSDEGGQE